MVPQFWPIHVRPARAADVHRIATIQVAAWEAAYRGLVPDEQIAARTVERRIGQWRAVLERSDYIALVACDEDELIQGFASATRTTAGPFESYLETLYVMPDAWRRGIGRKLLCAIAVRLHKAGIKNTALRTLRLSEACAFYERLGARLVPEGIPRDADRFDDVVYAFDDLAGLAGETES